MSDRKPATDPAIAPTQPARLSSEMAVPRPASEPAVAGPADSAPRIPTAAIAHVSKGQWKRGMPTSATIAQAILWVVVALPALYQLVLLGTAISGRIAYPYDLEWMEGGMLHHALRIQQGRGIYVAPSVDFIPYLYTPLYPALLAVFGNLFGLSYVLGRVASVLSLVGIAIVVVLSLRPRGDEARGPAYAGALLALGLFAAVYPYLEGWFDLVRADTLFLFMVTAAIAALPRWAREGDGLGGHARVAAGAALLALAFFCKQTGIVYVALGGFVVLVTAWRRVPTFVATAGLLGLGGTALLQATTDGWFWTYASEIHRAHDFNMDRFWASFGNILWHFPTLTIVVAATLLVVAITALRFRTLPRPAWRFLLWTLTFAVSTLVGAIGWGTEFAHFNAYMPAFLHGAVAAGAALPALHACTRAHVGQRRVTPYVALAISLGAGAALAHVCWTKRWDPRPFIPAPADAAAGDALITRVRAIEGPVFMPSHPWYLHLAGKEPRVHRMGIKDVTWRQPRKVEGLDEALRKRKFAALVLDDADLHNRELPIITGLYRPAYKLPKTERPRVFTGARVTPDAIWLPITPAKPPAGMRALFDFEQPSWAGWTKTGAAWGTGPVTAPHPGQDFVLGATGARFATSMHDGDKTTGRVTSPSFAVASPVLLLKLGGGTDETKLRVEVWIDEQIVATASVPKPGGEALREVMVDLGAHEGKQAKLVLVDDSPTGHLNIDDVLVKQ